MVWIPGGRFVMGSDLHYPEEAPAHMVSVDGFWIDRSPVTNAQFLKFVKATGHVTLAEQPADPAQYPDALPELLVPSSIVFVPPPGPIGTGDPYRWWQYIAGADWRHPEGPGSSIKSRDHHPVVHVAHADAAAYAAWSGKQLPSETEWERAAWGGREGAEFAWGEELHPGGRPVANTFQGDFPHHNSLLDGYAGTSPVGVFPANGYGLFDTIGNVWEWTDSWYANHAPMAEQELTAEGSSGCCDRAADAREASIDPTSQHGAMPRKVVKGGSYLCAPSYCRRYRPAARMAQGIDTSTSHMGFRCIVRL
ncbi:formylglycine-generating enzyme family protein [Synechococcus sp. 1G10]|uniref:formylglycine-generating enzyme family protein n=1 Tax=Synechococcus sp. 1G10 TaxID=2025605 RepID=UPI000B9868DC|nr:formylglycine-generating enzyme family protein [Synechococcus sp. 1G10]